MWCLKILYFREYKYKNRHFNSDLKQFRKVTLVLITDIIYREVPICIFVLYYAPVCFHLARDVRRDVCVMLRPRYQELRWPCNSQGVMLDLTKR